MTRLEKNKSKKQLLISLILGYSLSLIFILLFIFVILTKLKINPFIIFSLLGTLTIMLIISLMIFDKINNYRRNFLREKQNNYLSRAVKSLTNDDFETAKHIHDNCLKSEQYKSFLLGLYIGHSYNSTDLERKSKSTEILKNFIKN